MRKSLNIGLAFCGILLVGTVTYFGVSVKPAIPQQDLEPAAVNSNSVPNAEPAGTMDYTTSKVDATQPKDVTVEPNNEEKTETFHVPLEKSFNKAASSPDLSEYDYSIKQEKKREYHLSPNVTVHKHSLDIKLDQEGNQSVNINTSKQVMYNSKF